MDKKWDVYFTYLPMMISIEMYLSLSYTLEIHVSRKYYILLTWYKFPDKGGHKSYK